LIENKGFEMFEPTMEKHRGDGVNLQLAKWAGNGKSILCVHGITANCRCWDVLASVLSPTYRVLAMDLRGRGGSDKPEKGYSLDHHIGDINCLMDDLGLDQVVLMGHSLGAFISLVFGATYPQRVDRIVLVDGGGQLSKEQMDKVFEGIKPALDRLGKIFPSADAYIETMKKAPYLQPWSSALKTYCDYELEEIEGGVRCNIQAAHIQEEAANIRNVSPQEFYAKVSCKALVLRATRGLLSEDDILLPETVVERMVNEIPQATRVDIADVNHYGIIFQPNALRDHALLNFLSQ
jgi:pimeloyl-ACP methyl ester carboxylesterase